MSDRYVPTRLSDGIEKMSSCFLTFHFFFTPVFSDGKMTGISYLTIILPIVFLPERYSNVRLFVAGHMIIPSVVKKNGIIHLLSPQRIKAPCGYDKLTLFPEGVVHATYEIDEQHYGEVARVTYTHKGDERYGDECGRNFYLPYSA